tara:strand:+ start:491 stop:1144 length:654 start_codon:yes stop_codon:yes gene_type:complete
MNDLSQFAQSNYLLKYLNYDSGFFIEAGANDGLKFSNTYLFESEKKWKGLLVEPNYNQYIECKKNRPNSIVENYALVGKDFKKDYVRGSFDSGPLSLTARVIDINQETITQNYLREIFIHLKQRKLVKVKAITLDGLLSKHKIRDIDLLYLDTEEYELPILKGINLKKYRPKYIVVEIHTQKMKTYNLIQEYLSLNKYKFLEKIPDSEDYLYVDCFL